MDDLLYYAVSAAGAAVFWWRYRRGTGGARSRLAAHELRDEELQIVLHVAGHEAKARGQPVLVEHLLLALVQSESVAGAIGRSGGDAEAVEDRVSAALDSAARDPGPALVASDAAATALALTAGMAGHHGRPATCADLWFALMRPPRGHELIEAAGVDPTAVLFVLAHGVAERDLAAAPEPRESRQATELTEIDDIELVLVNDDFSPQQLVVHVLCDGLGLREDEATRLMLKTHREGNASLGRHPKAHARKAAQAVVSLARRQGYPLWIRLLP